ncbi:hypothetical protein [Streptomyces sp. I05A-00742]|uniref:hypothetical protein n=1 Tax=Streptomyces sp. I05A-00742 TaxID=2732853 RepID=UPI0014896FCB|nr:hypothetical protein [Streptomyces sp. I05A-00742]
MTVIRMTPVRRGVLPMAVLAVLATGCGTQRSADSADADRSSHPTSSEAPAPNTPVDFPCADGSAPPATADAAPPAEPGDHYAENHRFRVPIALHGRARCAGLAAVERVNGALGPLRRRGDFAPEHTRDALARLFPAGKVRSERHGSNGVGFLIVTGASPPCVEGSMTRESLQAEAFGGYPDGSDCEPPSGGH